MSKNIKIDVDFIKKALIKGIKDENNEYPDSKIKLKNPEIQRIIDEHADTFMENLIIELEYIRSMDIFIDMIDEIESIEE